jgi:receptor protein-tyrosine kinase
MTDNPEPLNLIERMAKRLAAEDSSATNSAQPRADSFVERAAQKIAGMPRATGFEAATHGEKSGHYEQKQQAPAAASASLPTSGAVAPPPGVAVNKNQVRLDFRALRQDGMITPDNLTSSISNEFRGIKRKLLQKVRDPKTRATVNNLIMITSSLPGEGKTFSSINLALSLAAERGLQVLLIDADIVRPSIGKMFVDPPKVGLTELLSGKTPNVSDVLHRCADIPNLAVIFSGSPKNGSPELISSREMVTLCQELSRQYPDRVILIDTPPVLASTEAAILASYVHQVIMVVSAAQTDKHQLRQSLESVSSCQNISLLFNKAPNWNEGEYKSYYGYAEPAGRPTTTPPQA